MGIYDLWAILIWGIIALLLILVIVPIYNSFKYSKGKGRRISGEILKDIGIAIMVGGAFKFRMLELIFYVTILLGALFIVWGTIMKEDKK